MPFRAAWIGVACARAPATVALAACPRPGSAHVKWFCAYNVAASPRDLGRVLSPDFDRLVLLTLAVLLMAAILDRTPVGAAIQRALDRVFFLLRDRAELMIRLTLAGFFLCLWHLGGIILTPELKTSAGWVPPLQLGIALCMVSRRTLPAAAAGMVALYAYAIDQYCVFHLLDYPIFLGLALYVALLGLGREPFGQRPLDLLRWAAAATLMWASVEKWAYPQWTYPLLARHPEMTFGFDSHFYMSAAGIVEFALAFTLACGPLMRRVSAILLSAMFISAIFEFGYIDAIGHAAIIAVLFAIIGDRGEARPRRPWLARPVGLFGAPAAFCASLAATIGFYYGLHALFYRAAIG